jgi:hypothetical protein
MRLPVLLVLALQAGGSHPLHTTLATVEWRADRHQLEVAVRVFTQDLAEAISGAVSDSTACRYASGVLFLRDAAGRLMAAGSCSTERAADVTWIRLIVPAATPAGLWVLNALLFERFPDQVNIVQANVAGHARTILFTTGDGPKPLT